MTGRARLRSPVRLAGSSAYLIAAVALSITACDESVQQDDGETGGESSLTGGTGGAGQGGAGQGGAGNGGAGGCDAGFADCDQDPANGCERDTLADGPCACAPGDTQTCYLGAPGTLGVGPCAAGTQACNPDGLDWGPCDGQVVPVTEVCANQIDDDCDATTDENLDEDGDGFTICDGDCCDSMVGCAIPGEVNPGAFERISNGVDDDCAPQTSDTEPAVDCSVSPLLSSVDALDIASAMDICQYAAANAPPSERRWGLLNAGLLSADGSAPKDVQLAVLAAYGTGGIAPVKGVTMAGLSTGTMRDQAAGYVAAGGGTGFGKLGAPPPAFVAAHGGELPTAAGCPVGSGANDSVNVKLTIRVPTNADVFSYRYRFLAADYTSRVCSPYNDFALALLTTQAAGIPADTNILFDSLKNFASVNTAFFEVCAPQGPGQCPAGIGELAGTGLDPDDSGAGTLWLTSEAPVVPGETIQIEFTVFDVSDDLGDSVLLLDDFQWVF